MNGKYFYFASNRWIQSSDLEYKDDIRYLLYALTDSRKTIDIEVFEKIVDAINKNSEISIEKKTDFLIKLHPQLHQRENALVFFGKDENDQFFIINSGHKKSSELRAAEFNQVFGKLATPEQKRDYISYLLKGFDTQLLTKENVSESNWLNSYLFIYPDNLEMLLNQMKIWNIKCDDTVQKILFNFLHFIEDPEVVEEFSEIINSKKKD